MRKQKRDFFWQIYANVYDLVRFLPPYKNLLQDVKKAADIKSKDKVLDAGCGTGNFIKLMTPETEAKFTGIDISGIMLTKARKRLHSYPNVTLLQGDLNERLPFSNNNFDCIIATNSVYAVIDPNFTFSELIRVSKLGGTLVIVNPHSKAKFITTYFQILNSGKGLEKISLFFVTLPLFLFNLLIKIKASKKDFHFLSQEDWKKVIKSFTIKSLMIKETYMQSYQLKIKKK